MPIDRRGGRATWLELAFLLVSAPLLLFPTLQPLLTAAALLLLAVGWLYFWHRSGVVLPSTPFNTAMLFWALSVAVGILVTADPDLTLPKATGLILGFAVWRYLALTTTGQSRLWLGVGALLAVGGAMAALGVISADWRFEIDFVRRLFPWLPPQLLALPGAPDLGVHRNELAGVTLFIFPLLLALAVSPRSLPRAPFSGLLAAVAAILLALLLLLTQSRSAWMGATVAVLVVAFLHALLLPRASRWRRPLYTALLLVTLLLLIAAVSLWPKLWAAGDPDLSADTAIGTFSTMAFRYEVWQWAAVALGDFSFTGTGLGTFRRVVGRLYPIAYPTDIAHAHNIFLQVGLDTGLPGLISYLALLFVGGKVAWNAARTSNPLRPVAIGLLASIVAFHVYGLTDALAPGSKPALVFWMALGLLAAMGQLKPIPSHSGSPSSSPSSSRSPSSSSSSSRSISIQE